MRPCKHRRCDNLDLRSYHNCCCCKMGGSPWTCSVCGRSECQCCGKAIYRSKNWIWLTAQFWRTARRRTSRTTRKGDIARPGESPCVGGDSPDYLRGVFDAAVDPPHRRG